MITTLLVAACRSLLTATLAEWSFRMLRLRHPVFRKAVWACVLLASFAMPMLQARSLWIRLPMFQNLTSTGGSSEAGLNGWKAFTTVHLATAAEPLAVHGFQPGTYFPPLSAVVLTLYLSVAGILLLRIVCGVLTAMRLTLRSEPLGMKQERSVRVSAAIKTPWTFGPWILLPAQACVWDEEQLQLVLAHEECHVRQFDFYLQLLARLYTSVFWFSPLGWWLLHECERLGEQTSDRAALAVTRDASDYANLLLRFSTENALPAVCMARRLGMQTRIETLLDCGALNRLFERPRRAAICALCIVTLSVAAGNLGLRGQAASGTGELARPTVPFQTFDVVAVKPNKADSDNMGLSSDETTLRATNVSLPMLLMNAYRIRTSLISGLPKWAESNHYDVNAKVSEPNPAFKDRVLSRNEREAIWQARIQAMLADSFHLKVHYEMVTAPVYDLVLLPGGPKFDTTKVPDSQEGMSVNNSTLAASHIPMKFLCSNLENTVERNVIDKTGLTGLYDINLTWTPEEQVNTAKDSGIANPPPDIYTALQEQLGLKLVPAKGLVRKLVVDSIEPPTAD